MSRNNRRLSDKVCGSASEGNSQAPFKKGSPVREKIILSRQENKVRDYADILGSNSVENKLFKSNYNIINKATLGEHNNYILAHNKDGIKVYILLDQSGFVMGRDHDVEYQRGESFLPSSVKNGILNGTQNMTAGAALVCDNGICTLLYDNDSSVIEENFNNSQIEEEQYPLAYPIVRLSEIVSNPRAVDLSVSCANRNMINNSYSILNQELQDLVDDAKTLSNCAFHTKNLINKKTYELETSINQIMKVHNHFINNAPASDKERQYVEEVEEALKIRHDQIHTLMTIIQKVANEKKNIKRIIQNISQYAEFCENKII